MPTLGKVFIDTNVLLYAVDAADKKRRNVARSLLKSLIRERRGTVSTQVAQEFYAIATKKLKVEPLAAKRVLEHLDNFEVVAVDLELIYEAIDCSILSQISFWDALVIVTARVSGCKELYSEDMGHRQIIRGVRIVNPFQ